MAKLNPGEKVLSAPVSEGLHKDVRIRAIQEGRSLAGVLEDAVRLYLKTEPAMT